MPQVARKKMQRLECLKDQVEFWKNVEEEIELLKEMFQDEGFDEEDTAKAVEGLEQKIDTKEIDVLLDGKYDGEGAIVTFSAGAGGVDAQDWAEILMRMIVRYSERRDYKVRLLHEHKGAEAGIKSASLLVEGLNAYGFLKSESGIHRLVRISPFDADKARHTSFALVDVAPQIEEAELKIDQKDLRIDTFKASGAGGQHVNKTDSAVRITHLPSKLVAACQSERSQLQNKEAAMKILRSKLAALEHKKAEEKRAKERGDHVSVEWGNQIRSYFLHPYQLVKDHRTGFEDKDIKSVLDGKLDGFVEAFLKWQKQKK